MSCTPALRYSPAAAGAAAAAVAPSPPPARPQKARAGFEAILRPSTWRQRVLRPASAAATRGGGVASFHPARRGWRHQEGRGDGARLAPRCSRYGDELLSVTDHRVVLASRALQKMETAANKLAKVFAEEVPGTLSSLKLSFMEINDLTSQLKNLRKRITISRFGKNANSKASSSSW